MIIDSETKMCISISENPGNLGSFVHNHLYQKYNLNYIYKPFRINSWELTSAIKGMRSFGIKGCSVSTPFKKEILKHVDSIAPSASYTKNANTVVNHTDFISAHNTDTFGAKKVIENIILKLGEKATFLVVGAGATTASVCLALRELGIKKFAVSNRTALKVKELSNLFPELENIPFDLAHTFDSTVLINTTTVGLTSDNTSFKTPLWKNKQFVFDVVNKDTELCKEAKKEGIPCLNGKLMAIWQSIRQFELYTDHKLNFPSQEVDDIIKLI